MENEKEVLEGESIKSCKAEEQLKNAKGSLCAHWRGRCTCTLCTNKKPVSKILRCCNVTITKRTMSRQGSPRVSEHDENNGCRFSSVCPVSPSPLSHCLPLSLSALIPIVHFYFSCPSFLTSFPLFGTKHKNRRPKSSDQGETLFLS